MKKIVIAYWREQDLVPEFKDNMVHDYSPEKLSEIIQIIVSHGLSAMVRPSLPPSGHMLIYVNNGGFKQM